MMLFGFDTIFCDKDGYPVDEESDYITSAFVICGYVILVWNHRKLEIDEDV